MPEIMPPQGTYIHLGYLAGKDSQASQAIQDRFAAQGVNVGNGATGPGFQAVLGKDLIAFGGGSALKLRAVGSMEAGFGVMFPHDTGRVVTGGASEVRDETVRSMSLRLGGAVSGEIGVASLVSLRLSALGGIDQNRDNAIYAGGRLTATALNPLLGPARLGAYIQADTMPWQGAADNARISVGLTTVF